MENLWPGNNKVNKKQNKTIEYETRTTVCMALTGNGHKHILPTLSSTIDEF